MSSTNIINRKISRRSVFKVGGISALTMLAGAPSAEASGPITSVSSAPTTGGATTWLNVRSFGAAGNGSTDDTAALNAACTAARALAGTGNGVAVVYVPAGMYKITSTINVWNVFLKGDGQGATRINCASDWAKSGPNSSWALDQQPSSGSGGGVGLPAPNASSVGTPPTEGTWIEDVWVAGPGAITRGSIPCNLSGVRVGAGAGYSRMRIDGFYAGAFLFSDHEKLLGPGSQGGNYYGVYYGEPSASSGDQVISDIQLDGSAWASIGISQNKAFGNASFRKLHLGSAPFGIYKEEASGGPLLANVVMSNVAFESAGNANIFVNGPNGGSADVLDCVFDNVQSTNAIDPGTNIPISTTDSHGRAIGRYAAPIDLGGGTWNGNEVLASDPAYPHAGITSYPALVACGMFIGGRYGPGQPGIDRVNQDGKVFTTGGNTGDAIIVYRGTTCRLLRMSGATTVPAWSLVESAGGGQPGCQLSTGTRRPMGVAMHPAASGQTVPIAYSGVVTIKSGTNSIAANDPLVADPTQPGCVKTGQVTSVGILGVAQAASSSGSVSALLQSL